MMDLKERADQAKADGEDHFVVGDSIMVHILDLHDWFGDLNEKAKELGYEVVVEDCQILVVIPEG